MVSLSVSTIIGAVTVTTAVAEPEPPAPVQVRVYDCIPVVFRVPVEPVPEVALLPLQAPLAVQAVALVLLQVNVALPPVVILDGDAVRVTVGAGVVGVVAVTDTAADCVTEPPVPIQVILNVCVPVVLSAPEACEPLVLFVPLQAPLAVQLVALVAAQVRVALPPAVTLDGEAERVRVGAGVVGGGVVPEIASSGPIS